MANFDTIKAITTNLQSVCEGLGLKFDKTISTDVTKIPAALIPFGQIFYKGEVFEDVFNERPEYAEVSFDIRVILSENNPIDIMRGQQKWTHKLRDAISVTALNIGDLSSSKLVSRTATREVVAESLSTVLASITMDTIIRYREV